MRTSSFTLLFSMGFIFTPVADTGSFSFGESAFAIEFVTVGNPGNEVDPDGANDGTSGYGSVGYTFRMGKYEITAGEYTEFLNAVANEDTYNLYDTVMDYDANPGLWGCNIKRTGDPGNYTYSVASDWANRPVNWVTFWNAARFANWLHNGQPTGAQDETTTEDGAYELNGYNGFDGREIVRKPGARFFIPTESEWYKAAYHKNDGPLGNYWDYATESDAEPINTLPDPGNHGNFYDYEGNGNNDYTIGAPYYRTERGEFENSPSPYGTFDQAGNVMEWNETLVLREADTGYGNRGLRGAAFFNMPSTSAANIRGWSDPSGRWFPIGFRVAAVLPEPDTLPLTITTLGCLLLRRK